METSKSSLTSLIAAFGRAYHSKFDHPKIFDDFIANDLLSNEEFQAISNNMIEGMSFFNKDLAEELSDNKEEMLKWITQVQLSPTPLARAAYCESVLLNELSLGVSQYVILGAGLDTFALRHRELESKINIFEIDHPSTQQYKIEKLHQLDDSIPNNVQYVPIDFTEKFSNEALINAGFHNRKTFYSLLGVSYYLSKSDTMNLLQHLFNHLPPGSSIVFDYADETLFTEKGKANRVTNMVKMAAASGEPMVSCYTFSELENMLQKAGLLIYEHLSPEMIQQKYFASRKDYLSAFETIHYIHAVKQK